MTTSKSRFAAPLAVLLSAILALPAAAQATRDAPVSVPELIFDAPYEIPSLGLSVFLPEDALVDLESFLAAQTNVKVIPQGVDRSWILQIRNSISSNTDLTLEDAVANIVEKSKELHTRREGRRTETLVRIFDEDDTLLIGGRNAHRVYMDIPSKPDVPTTGFTLFQNGPGQFVIFQFDCIGTSFPAMRQMYETIVASVQFRDGEEMKAERAQALLAGQNLIREFGASSLEDIFDNETRFFRIYRPAPGGAPSDAQELGYERVNLRKGFAGEVDGKDQSGWKAGDRATGMIAEIVGRRLAEGMIVDSIATFFLSDDRSRELWSIRMSIRRGNDEDTWIETGYRVDDNLVVNTAQDGQEPTQSQWSPLPSGYASRVMLYALPRIIVPNELAGVYGYYAYESQLGKLSLRRDVYKAEGPDVWSIVTQVTEDSPETGTLVNLRGGIIRRELPGNIISEPVDRDRLRRLWRDKNLPVD